MGVINVYAGLFDDKWIPEMHIFYPERIMDVKDGKPKFKGMPAAFGGTDDMVAE